MLEQQIADIIHRFKEDQKKARRAGYSTKSLSCIGDNLEKVLSGTLRTADYTITSSNVLSADAAYIREHPSDWSAFVSKISFEQLDNYLERNFTFDVALHVAGLVSGMLAQSSEDTKANSPASKSLVNRLQKLSEITYTRLVKQYPDIFNFLPVSATNDDTLIVSTLFNNNCSCTHKPDISNVLRGVMRRFLFSGVTVGSIAKFVQTINLEAQPDVVQSAYLELFYTKGYQNLIKPEYLALRELGINFDKILDATHIDIPSVSLPNALIP